MTQAATLKTSARTTSGRTAILYRMATGQHICPSGLKARDLLKSQGFSVEEHLLQDRAAVDAFKAEQDVATTPQVFIAGQRIGGFTDLQDHFGMERPDPNAKSYAPVLWIFAVSFLAAPAIDWRLDGALDVITIFEMFVATLMVILGVQKLRDLESFRSMFITYDLLAMRDTRYAYVYPFVETGAGILMIAGALTWLSAPAALFVAGVNGISVFKAVYIDKRELNCACVGGNSNVPLGFLSLTENILMVAMAVWMLAKLMIL
ncbi:MAG: MauE/DoxX family redox-associated membrane protein [Pseudomonadota bacterium]